ncbi:MAG: hypothetical protein K0Q63_2035 [Paenibacillus sp.]|nr:hypothetical protein [Paenibacillus sp.]
MSREDESWIKALKDAPLYSRHFDDSHKRVIRSRIGKKTRGRRSRRLSALACLAGVLIGFGMLYGTDLAERIDKTMTTVPNHAYYNKGELLLQVFPDPELKAGKTYGYLFHFANPTKKKFIGKKLAIDAVHLETGQRFVAVPLVSMDEQLYAETSWERYIVQCALPFGGLWRYEVKLNGTPYASVVLDVGEPDWEPSPTFHSGDYAMTGIEGVIGFIDAGFIAKHPNKYMWHVWGEPDELDGTFQVMAVKQGSKQLISVISGLRFGGPLNGADGATPTMMTLPEPGIWRLLPFIGGRLMDSIVVEVREGDKQP